MNMDQHGHAAVTGESSNSVSAKPDNPAPNFAGLHICIDRRSVVTDANGNIFWIDPEHGTVTPI